MWYITHPIYIKFWHGSNFYGCMLLKTQYLRGCDITFVLSYLLTIIERVLCCEILLILPAIYLKARITKPIINAYYGDGNVQSIC